jgi:ribosomal RNA assembly protein
MLTGDIEITSQNANAVTFYRLETVIKAIGRGFSPDHAKFLLDDNSTLNIINLHDLGIHTDKTLETRRARVIGSQGIVRKFLEDTLECFIAIQGKTIAIIGEVSKIRIAHEAIMRLLKGANVAGVKKFIESSLKNADYVSNTESNYIDIKDTEIDENEKDILDD